MLERVSFDQLRMFVASADEGSFSAAARRVRRTQSAVSEAILSLEAQLGVVLFDRAGRYPRLTKEGVVLLADARAVITGVDAMKARAKGIAGGLEAELTAVLDVFLPIEVIAEAAREFRIQFPATPLRLYVEALGSAVQPVLDGRASFGVVGSLPTLPTGLIKERLFDVKLMMVAAASHPLASYRGIIPKEELACAACPDGSIHAHGRPQHRRNVAVYLAPGGPLCEVCLPCQWPRIWGHAPAHRGKGYCRRAARRAFDRSGAAWRAASSHVRCL